VLPPTQREDLVVPRRRKTKIAARLVAPDLKDPVHNGHGRIIERPPHLWKPGESGNSYRTAPRAKVTREKLGQSFVGAIYEDFIEFGQAAIVRVRKEEPGTYLKIIASMLPKELHVKDTTFNDIPDDTLNRLLDAIDQIGAASREGRTLPTLIEGEAQEILEE
jgi:hypothetical protein